MTADAGVRGCRDPHRRGDADKAAGLAAARRGIRDNPAATTGSPVRAHLAGLRLVLDSRDERPVNAAVAERVEP